MLVKSKLFFRRFEKRQLNNVDYLQLYFLDEKDISYTFLVPDIKENEKYLRMQKDTLVELDLTLYAPRDKNKCKYNFYLN